MSGFKGIVGTAFLLAGLLFAGLGLARAWEVNSLALTGAHARGEVVSMNRTSKGGRGQSWYAGVVFRTEAGQEIGFENPQGSALRSYDEGDKVDVTYAPANPENAIIDNFWTRAAGIFVALFASLFVFLGLWLIRLDRREAKELGWVR